MIVRFTTNQTIIKDAIKNSWPLTLAAVAANPSITEKTAMTLWKTTNNTRKRLLANPNCPDKIIDWALRKTREDKTYGYHLHALCERTPIQPEHLQQLLDVIAHGKPGTEEILGTLANNPAISLQQLCYIPAAKDKAKEITYRAAYEKWGNNPRKWEMLLVLQEDWEHNIETLIDTVNTLETL